MSRMSWAYVSGAVATALLSAGLPSMAAPAAGAGGGPPSSDVTLGSTASKNGAFVFDYGVPSSPALNLIGLTPDKTTVSTSLKPFVLSLPNLVSGGNGQSAALDIAPFWILGNNDRDGYFDYIDTSSPGSYFTRLAYRFRTELALYTGDDGGGVASKQKPSQIAFGFSVSLLDDSDPLMASDPGKPTTGDPRADSAWLTCLNTNQADLQPYTDLSDEASLRQYLALMADAALTLATAESPSDQSTLTVRQLADLERFRDTVIQLPPEKIAVLKKMGVDTSVPPVGSDHDRIAFDLALIETAVLGQASAVAAPLPAPEATRIAADTKRIADDFTTVDALQAKLLVDTSDAKVAADNKALKLINACTAKANTAARFAPNLSLGAGVDLQGAPGSLNDFKTGATVVWLAGKYPIGLAIAPSGQKDAPDVSDGGGANNMDVPELNYWMIGGSARASFGEFVATGGSTTPKIKANTFNGWLGLERNSSWLVLSARAGYQDVSAIDSAQAKFSKSGWRWLASTSLKLSSEENGIWLDASYGSAQGTTTTLDDKTFLLALHFGPGDPANLFGENGK
jgi:hypothetical protein